MNQTSLFTTGIRFGQAESDNQGDQEEPEAPTTAILAPSRTRHPPRPSTAIPVASADNEDGELGEATPTSSHHRTIPTSVAEAEEALEEEEEAAEELFDDVFGDTDGQDTESELQQEEEEILEAELAEHTSPFAKRSAQKDLEPELDDDFDDITGENDIAGEETSDELDQGDSSDDGEPAESAPESPVDEQEDDSPFEDPISEVEEPAPVLTRPGQTFGSSKSGVVPLYDGSIIYNVPKTGYYCVGKHDESALRQSSMCPDSGTMC